MIVNTDHRIDLIAQLSVREMRAGYRIDGINGEQLAPWCTVCVKFIVVPFEFRGTTVDALMAIWVEHVAHEHWEQLAKEYRRIKVENERLVPKLTAEIDRLTDELINARSDLAEARKLLIDRAVPIVVPHTESVVIRAGSTERVELPTLEEGNGHLCSDGEHVYLTTRENCKRCGADDQASD